MGDRIAHDVAKNFHGKITGRVFGWLVLGGRCRTCHLPISPRYPIVELTVGLCIFTVAWVEYYTAGGILPFWPTLHGHRGALFTPPLSIEALFVMLYHTHSIAGLSVGLGAGSFRWSSSAVEADDMDAADHAAATPALSDTDGGAMANECQNVEPRSSIS